MCKVTINGKTYLGNNEDSWRTGSRINFVNAPVGKLGALYVSYSDLFPQGGMNEAGLAFDGLTIYKEKIKVDSSKKTVTNFSQFVTEIMQTCKTVEEVEQFAIQYNRHIISNGQLFFADKSGHYLVMEPDTLILGNDDKYIIANFCPSVTPEKERLDWTRYRRGREFINTHQSDTTANYCLALVDTMHECREKMGDGTMYSSIADLQNGDFRLYFYHDYTKEVTFNLASELAKGDHILDIVSLFPKNAEYEILAGYKVPQNDKRIFLFLLFCGVIFAFSAVYFLIGYLISQRRLTRFPDSYLGFKLLLFVISVPMLYYMFLLVRNPGIFYSQAPYHDIQFSLKNIVAYLPFILILLILPLLNVNIKVFAKNIWRMPSKLLLTLNNLIYLMLIFLFIYWGFYDVL
ncbi:hypothetical protein [Dyadobacter arcticus]|uniref:Choloylglycine hydrolase/NAAA C-terminal domain-containing protein n=1 Tax=Dyadobacter arcticus TaxID=1078754 RepID=A0ABX0UQ91_9BACT|nr:hypothetical protein [Dyadobacter arcticus]NIJ54583.1 hypothetical protein [Dyadobacter arcticus]